MTKENTDEINKEICFNVERDISQENKEKIDDSLEILHKRAIIFEDPFYWESYAVNCMFRKILFPSEEIERLNTMTEKAIENASLLHFEMGNLGRHLNLAVGQKLLFPEKWKNDPRGFEFYNDKIVWKILLENLKYISPSDEWDNLYTFFQFAQNMKILAPEKFETVNLQDILGKEIWVEDIKDELMLAGADFALLASTIQILEYPGKIELDALEWAEMDEEAQEIAKEGDSLYFAEYSARRKILAAKEIRITNESFDLIF